MSGRVVAPRDPARDWADFRERLAVMFASFELEMAVVINVGEHQFVQAAQNDAPGLICQAAVPGTPDGCARLEAAGWLRSASDPLYELGVVPPVPVATYRAMADSCLVALRDVFGAPMPGVLTYASWLDVLAVPGPRGGYETVREGEDHHEVDLGIGMDWYPTS